MTPKGKGTGPAAGSPQAGTLTLGSAPELKDLPVYDSSFGMTLTVSGGGAGVERTVAKPKLDDLSVTLAAGAQSGALLHAVQNGAAQWATAAQALGGGGKNAGHVYKLDNVQARSIHDSATGRAVDASLETLTFGTSRIEQDDGGNSGCWDLTTSAVCTP